MDIRKMKKKDFKDIPDAKYGDLIHFHSLVIIPTGEIHDSGFRCMEFVAVGKNDEPICKLSGGSDVIHIDGIGGYGEWRACDGGPRLVVPYGWRIDCIPCGYLRLFGDWHGLKAEQDYCSDFEVYRDAK
jgi:hypothetical protein